MEQALEPITIRGRYFWRGNDRFLVRGVVYQIYEYGPERWSSDGRPADPIADDRLPQLRNDIALFKELRINTIFVYHFDNAKSHDQAMKMLEEAGIYVLATISTPRCCINRFAPYGSYNTENMNFFFRTVDGLARYSNTLGVLAAHLLINSDKYTSCTPVISAVVRDLREYMKLRKDITGQRVLPVGYGAATTYDLDRGILEHLSSGEEVGRIDFWTVITSFLAIVSSERSKFATVYGLLLGGESGSQDSDYKQLIERYEDARLPIFFSEYGGVGRRPRTFEETLALYSPSMMKVFSGGCVYEFWYGSNQYGLVSMHPDTEGPYKEDPALALDHTRQNERGTLLVLKDFENYKDRLHATSEIEPNSESNQEETAVIASDQIQTSRQRSLNNLGQIPESCVNWDEIEEKMRTTS